MKDINQRLTDLENENVYLRLKISSIVNKIDFITSIWSILINTLVSTLIASTIYAFISLRVFNQIDYTNLIVVSIYILLVVFVIYLISFFVTRFAKKRFEK